MVTRQQEALAFLRGVRLAFDGEKVEPQSIELNGSVGVVKVTAKAKSRFRFQTLSVLSLILDAELCSVEVAGEEMLAVSPVRAEVFSEVAAWFSHAVTCKAGDELTLTFRFPQLHEDPA